MSNVSEIRAAKAKAVGGKKDRCRRGKSCSATCISGWKACLVEMPDMVASSINKLRNRVQTGVSKVGRIVPGKSRKQFLGKKKEDYLRVRGKLAAKVKRSYLKGDEGLAMRGRAKLHRLENKAGSKLNIPKIKDEELSSKSIRERRERYYSVKGDLKKRLKDAASTGDLNRYNKLEKALLDLTGKAGKKFGDKEIWKPSRQDREDIRKQKYNKAQEKIIDRLKEAAQKKDRDEYLRILESSGKMHHRTGWKFGALKMEGDEIWREFSPKGPGVVPVLETFRNLKTKTVGVSGTINPDKVNWESGGGKEAKYAGSGAYGSFVHVPEGRLVKGLEAGFPGGVGVKYGDVSPREVELLKKIGETGAGPRLIAAKYEEKPGYDHSEARKGMIAMERIPGKTLKDKFQSDGMTEEKLGDAYLRGISKLHKAGISHGDAHYENAIMQPDGKVKFLDFGLSKISSTAALAEARNAIEFAKGPVADKLRSNMERLEAKGLFSGFSLSDLYNPMVPPSSMTQTQQSREKRAMELIEELYKGL